MSGMLLVGAHVVELSAVAVALMLHRRGDRSLALFLTSPAGLAGVAALLTLVVALLALAYLVRGLAPPRLKRLAVPIVLNLASLVFVFGIAETAVRLLATPTVQGPAVAGMVLLPHRWTDVSAHGRALLDRVAGGQTYLVPDSELGWTIGPGRQSADYNRRNVERFLDRIGQAPPPPAAADPGGDIYASSVEGLRSPRPGVSLNAGPARRRIAVVGDSFTFGLEVRYEDTWAHQLERGLGAGFQVLNFGVDGYGVDQAYLRYRRDVEAWHPEIVVLGVIADDFRRTMCVYAFLCFPDFGMPFAKPRLALTERGPAAVNLPLAAPASIFASRSIDDLPFLALDGSFDPAEWQARFYHRSYAVRLVLTRFRAWSTPRPEATRGLNVAIVRAFVDLARQRGTVPIVAFFPTRSTPGGALLSSGMAREVLGDHGIRYLDLSGCVGAVSPAERFLALHYSPRTNAAVAGCLREAITAGFQSSYADAARNISSTSTW